MISKWREHPGRRRPGWKHRTNYVDGAETQGGENNKIFESGEKGSHNCLRLIQGGREKEKYSLSNRESRKGFRLIVKSPKLIGQKGGVGGSHKTKTALLQSIFSKKSGSHNWLKCIRFMGGVRV